MDPCLKEWMNIDILWEAVISKSNTGDYTYAAPVTIKGYVAEGKKIRITGEDEEIMAKSTIYLDETHVDVQEGDRLTPPHDIARLVKLRNIYYDPPTGLPYLVEAFIV